MFLVALSLLQGGPLPCFMTEEQLHRIMTGDYSDLSQSQQQFSDGLDVLGVIQVCNCMHAVACSHNFHFVLQCSNCFVVTCPVMF